MKLRGLLLHKNGPSFDFQDGGKSRNFKAHSGKIPRVQELSVQVEQPVCGVFRNTFDT